jgi:diguanylate cyclase
MAAELEIALRGPDAFNLAHKALEAMTRHKVWPTPLNFELWLHYVGEPAGPLALAIEDLVNKGEQITETVSEELANTYLAKNLLNDQLRDAGDQLSRELESVSQVINAVQKSSEAYGRTLAGASEKIASDQEAPALKQIVDSLAAATRRVQRENSSLESKLTASTEEVVKLRHHLEQVRREAMTDALTNLSNRKAFDEALESACADGAAVTVAMLDIDHFKKFNDTWGHQTGDQVLRYVASVIGRVGDIAPRVAARYGGEEFSIIFPQEDATKVASMLDTVREEIGARTLKRRSTNEDLGAVTISIGVAQRAPGDPPAQLVGRADAALYASKRSGRNRVTNAEATAKAA